MLGCDQTLTFSLCDCDFSDQGCSRGISGRDGPTENLMMDAIKDSKYVLTYEDKDGDWMLVGDVPWE